MLIKSLKMSKEYDPKEIEPKWQARWEEEKIYKAEDPETSLFKSSKPKWYSLIEFPYPSGDGLHVGHVRSYTALDALSRKRRMEGHNVLYPIGWDAFGLPTENYAIKTGRQPVEITRENTDNFRRQLKSLGISFDWDREINTTDPKYYKWTQWIFLKFLEKGLAYKAKMPINWCPKDKIGLANEEVVDGKCERCGTEVEMREKEQWMLKITAYADRLLQDLDEVDYPERVKAQQRNWIGKSEGAEIEFRIKNKEYGIKVFTTRPDTIYGATFLVRAGKEDRFTGEYAINPATKEEIPIWEAEYVLSDYGTGAIMAVPAHDERDFEFAKKHDLPIKEVIEPLYITERGPDAVHKDKKFEERDTVVCIVKHWSEDKYVCLDWKDYGWKTFVVGGTEGDKPEDAAKREIEEETGYINIKSIKLLGNRIHNQFFARHKNVNRWARIQPIFVELADGTQKSVSNEEKEKHEAKWIPKEEVSSFLFDDASDQIFWQRAQGNNVAIPQSGFLINSGKFDGLESEEAKKKITKHVSGEWVTKYKLRDWVFSRQRYWGEPIPVIHCKKCGTVPVPEKDLPVELPVVEKYEPTDTGESPLAKIEEWVNVRCPLCGDMAKRETDTMPNWAGSSWYYLRYTDIENDKEFASPKKLKYFTPVDWYNGGMEHTTLHLLYSRFWHKFLFDLGFVPTSEPYKKRTSHGLILAEGGEKMSKSKGNVVNPDDIVKQFGADTLRLYEMFMGPFEQAIAWNEASLVGPRRFIERVWKLGGRSKKQEVSSKEGFLMHSTIKKVSEDIESMSFNTAVSAMMVWANELEKQETISEAEYKTLLKLLAPFAPHVTEEIWRDLGHEESIHTSDWPKWEEKNLLRDEVTYAVQVNGKVRGEIRVSKDLEEKEIEKLAQAEPDVAKWLTGKSVKKIIVVPKKIVNIVIA